MPTTPKRTLHASAAPDGGWTNFAVSVLDKSNDDRADMVAPRVQADPLYCSDFRFTRAELPDRAIVTGVNVWIEGNAALVGPDNGLVVGLRGAFGDSVRKSDQKRFALSPDIVHLFETDDNFSKTWGLSLSGFDVTSDPLFGCTISAGNSAAVPPANRRVDHVQISIEYDDPVQGYELHPVVRTQPDNGPSESFELDALFPDSGGPVEVTPGYDEIQDRRETISHRTNLQPRGYRPTCRLRFQVHDMARDHRTLATILSRLMDREWRVFLSVNGGAGEREVVLAKNKGPKVLTKQGVGAEFVIDLDAVDTVLELPPLRRTGASNLGSW